MNERHVLDASHNKMVFYTQGGIMKKLKTFLSRKLLVFILVPVIMVINVKIGSPLSEADVSELVKAALVYLTGQAFVDIATVLKGSKGD